LNFIYVGSQDEVACVRNRQMETGVLNLFYSSKNEQFATVPICHRDPRPWRKAYTSSRYTDKQWTGGHTTSPALPKYLLLTMVA